MNSIGNIWEALSRVGEQHCKGSLEKLFSNRLINQISVILATVAFLRVFIEIFIIGDYTGATFASIIGFGVSLVLVMNHFGYLQISRWFITIFFTVLVTILKITFGTIIGADFGYLLITLIAVILYRKRNEIIVGSLVIGAGFIFSVAFLNQNEPILAEQGNASTAYFFLIGTAICLVSILNRYIKNSQSYENELKFANHALKSGQIEIEQKNQELELLNDDMEKIVYSASHDLKTPLRNVISFLGLAQNKISKNETDEAKELLEVAQQNGLYLYSLLDDILQYSRINFDSENKETVDLNTLLDELKIALKTKIKDSNGALNFEKLPSIQANKNQMYALFQNLIENGLKYNKSIQPKVSITTFEDPHFTDIHFTDNGIGIDDSYDKQIFQMFRRLHSASEFEGNGIGLATCKRIAESMNCSIFLDTDYKKGSRFVFRIPKQLMVAA